MAAGAEYDISPFGVEAQRIVRLEKGHIIVGQDTDFDSTARRVHHDWMGKFEKEGFIGRHSVGRTNKIPLDKMLVGLEGNCAG